MIPATSTSSMKDVEQSMFIRNNKYLLISIAANILV